MRKILFFTLIVLLLSACGSRTSSINSFERFVNKVEARADTYTLEDWERADIEFEKYTDKYLNNNERHLTDNDKKKIGKLHAKYFAIRAKAYEKQLKEDIEDAVIYFEGFMEGLEEETQDYDNQ
jgi:two-component SAPR family response regulator